MPSSRQACSKAFLSKVSTFCGRLENTASNSSLRVTGSSNSVSPMINWYALCPSNAKENPGEMISARVSAFLFARAISLTASNVVSSTVSQAAWSAFGLTSSAAGSRDRMLLSPSFSKSSLAPAIFSS